MFWNKKPSTTDRLLEMLIEDRKVQAALVEKVLSVSEQQSGMMSKWLSFFENPPQPEVRIMTDADEYIHEKLRAPEMKNEAFTLSDFDTQSWLADVRHDFLEPSSN
jgi:hypothetical protein